jgi:hypothetical protein
MRSKLTVVSVIVTQVVGTVNVFGGLVIVVGGLIVVVGNTVDVGHGRYSVL